MGGKTQDLEKKSKSKKRNKLNKPNETPMDKQNADQIS